MPAKQRQTEKTIQEERTTLISRSEFLAMAKIHQHTFTLKRKKTTKVAVWFQINGDDKAESGLCHQKCHLCIMVWKEDLAAYIQFCEANAASVPLFINHLGWKLSSLMEAVGFG